MPVTRELAKELQRAAAAIRNARALIVTAGAGMGVDSGLPDFRGSTGLWKAYPPLKEKGLRLATMSNPAWFRNDPEFAWGFFGHRYNMYREVEPHGGFQILKNWAKQKDYDYFVFTSNVDGHFQKAGFDPDRVVECHGSINYLQCLHPISRVVWPMPEDTIFDVDESTLRAKAPFPVGPPGIDAFPTRPNILMFGDYEWQSSRTDGQERRMFTFQMTLQKEGGIPFVVIEIGAGLDVPTVRLTGEGMISHRNKGTLIRINPNEPDIPNGSKGVSLGMTGLEALERIQEIMEKD